MQKIKYDMELMKLISLFENLTTAKVKDAVSAPDKITFIVEENEIGKAVGRNGINVMRIENAIKKKIKIVEFSRDVTAFVRNYIHPLRAEITEEEGAIKIKGPDTKTKGLLIGRDRQNLNALEGIVKRYFEIKKIQVV